MRLFAVLRERAGRAELTLEDLPGELDMGGLKCELEARFPDLGALEHVAGVVGTEYVPDAHKLCEGDQVSLLPPVSGGAPEGAEADGADGTDGEAGLAAGVFELSADPLDPGALGRRVGHPACGATVVFTGSTRDFNRGQAVRQLDYEAFDEMAGPEMARIFADCRERFGLDEPRLRMLCAHRIGRVGVGEPSVVIAVASPHRVTAFEAARFLIDTLKERLPVWKKELYGDGHHWIGDRS